MNNPITAPKVNNTKTPYKININIFSWNLILLYCEYRIRFFVSYIFILFRLDCILTCIIVKCFDISLKLKDGALQVGHRKNPSRSLMNLGISCTLILNHCKWQQKYYYLVYVILKFYLS